MLRVAWKRFSVGAALILVALLAVSNAYATPPTTIYVFVAADLTLQHPDPITPSEIFVVLQAEGPKLDEILTNHVNGTLFLFFPPSPCATRSVGVSGTLFMNSTTEILAFTGFEPPDPCIGLGSAVVKITIGPAPTPFTPPDPCILILHFASGATATYAGKTARFIVTTTTATTSTTTSTTTLPP